MDISVSFQSLESALGQQDWLAATRYADDILGLVSIVPAWVPPFADIASLLPLLRAISGFLRPPIKREWLDFLDTQHEALQCLLIDADSPTRIEICAKLWRYWNARSQFQHGLNWVMEALALPKGASPEDVRECLLAAGVFLMRLSRHVEALQFFENVLDRLDEKPDLAMQSATYNYMGTLFRERGETVTSAKYFGMAWQLAEKIGYGPSLAAACSGMALIAIQSGDAPAAEDFFEHCALHYLQRGEPIKAGSAFGNVGHAARQRRDFAKAVGMYERALALFHRAGDRMQECLAWHNLGDSLSEMGRDDEARNALYQCVDLRIETGYYAGLGSTIECLSNIAFHQGRYFDAARLFTTAAIARTLYPLPSTPAGEAARREALDRLQTVLEPAAFRDACEQAVAADLCQVLQTLKELR